MIRRILRWWADRVAKEMQEAAEPDVRKLTYARLRSNQVDDWGDVVENENWDSLR